MVQKSGYCNQLRLVVEIPWFTGFWDTSQVVGCLGFLHHQQVAWHTLAFSDIFFDLQKPPKTSRQRVCVSPPTCTMISLYPMVWIFSPAFNSCSPPPAVRFWFSKVSDSVRNHFALVILIVGKFLTCPMTHELFFQREGKKHCPKMRREGTSDVVLFALFRSISGNNYGIPNKVHNVRKAQRNPIRYIVVTCHFRFRKKTGTIWSWVHSNGCNHDVDISTASLFHCSWWWLRIHCKP